MFSVLDKFVIDSNGNIGIGTTIPKCSLDLGSRTDGILIPQSSSSVTTNLGMIRLNTSSAQLEIYSNKLIQIPISPSISSVSTNILASIGSTTTVTGTNFEPTLQWILIGVDGQRYYPVVTYNSSTSVTLTRPSVFPRSNAPYRLFVHSVLTGLDYISPSIQIQPGSEPSFITNPGSLGTFIATFAITPVVVQTSDSDGTITSMNITSGSLPSGLSGTYISNGNFTISGTPSSVVNATTSTFTITATDNTSLTASQSFSITINSSLDGSTSERAAANATLIKNATGTTTNGNYWINNGSSTQQIYCDMSTDGGGWMLVYEVTNATRVSNAIVYTVNNSSFFSSANISRVAYYMQNNMNNAGTTYSAFTSFDSWSNSVSTYRVPSVSDPFTTHRNVTNLNVVSNHPQVSNVTGVSGRLEIWPYDYGTGSVLGGGNGSIYDFDDTPGTGGGYGSFQVHNITAQKTVIAWNNHNSATPDIGIGNNDNTNVSYRSNTSNTDWTFAGNGAYNFKLQVFIKAPGSALVITSTQPIGLNANTYSVASITTYTFTATSTAGPITWSITPTTYGNINSTTGALTITFPQNTTASGSFIVTATDSLNTTATQTWAYSIIVSDPNTIYDFPPAALTGRTTTLSTAYGAGTYTTNSGLNDTGFILQDYPSWKAFDKLLTYSEQYHGAWNVNPAVTDFDPIYSISSPYAIKTTTFPQATYPNLYMTVFNPSTSANINIAGDWVELTLPISIVLKSYVYTPRQGDGAASVNRSIGTWYVIGSNNGTSWNVLDYRTDETWPDGTNPAARTYTISGNSTAYSRYRLLCTNLSGAGGLFNFHELLYKGTIA